MDAHPMHGEIALLAEKPKAEGLLRKVTELNIECLVAHLSGNGLQHLAKQVFLAPFA